MASETPVTPHVFIVSYTVQGQINPLLRLAKHLASTGGFLVTFCTSAIVGQKIAEANGMVPGRVYPVGERGFLRFDFLDIGAARVTNRTQFPEFYSKLKLAGLNQLPKMIQRVSDEGLPVTCLINGNVVPWVADVAEELGIPLATVWAQSCTSFLTFYYYYNRLVPFPTQDHPYTDVEIPTLPLLKWDELHGLLHPFYSNPLMREARLQDFDNLSKSFCIIMDTFDELESDTINFSTRLCPIIRSIGPLFRDDPVAANTEIKTAADVSCSCLDWLDTQPLSSVVYVCLGSLVHLKQDQVDELANGILNSGAPFLWVVRTPDPSSGLEPYILPKNMVDDHSVGLVTGYSPQEKILDHPSVGCFITHCGWNSTVEALTSGVPMVAFPQWGDQLTDAKFLVDVLGVALRMGRGEQSSKVVLREEVERCIREAMVGPKAEEMRRKVVEWKEKAVKAYQQGGSSNTNLYAFVEEIRRMSTITDSK
ncbi:uncharacterized protein [Phyllobates terribilis]|uniref:uncharacterized protein n=1 Tax=Phyllobates terribilis TaxID=111132 RepID=UPI003CCB3B6D